MTLTIDFPAWLALVVAGLLLVTAVMSLIATWLDWKLQRFRRENEVPHE